MDNSAASDAFVGEFLLILGLCFVAYLIPSFIAFARGHPNRYVILVINVVLGGTGLGWLVSLIWALDVLHLEGRHFASQADTSGWNPAENKPRAAALTVWSDSVEHPRSQEEAPISAAAAVAQLEKLTHLKAAGHLSESEFAALKSAILKWLRS